LRLVLRLGALIMKNEPLLCVSQAPNRSLVIYL